MTDSLDTPVFVVNRWTRYGKDRAYVSVDEQQLGYRDLQTGEVHCELADHEETVARASDTLWKKAQAARYTPRHAVPERPSAVPPTTTTVTRAVAPGPPVARPAAAPPLPSGPRPLLPDRDLAGRAPGAAVRAQAEQLRKAAPVRTRVDRVLGRRTDERNWRIGADAEQAVAKRLGRLGPEWRLLHAVPVGDRGSDIDHVVIGPAGVFTVNTKNHPDANVWVRGDTVRVDGSNQPYVRNSRHEAGRAARLLSARALFDVEVHGVIAVMGMERGFTVVEQPRDGAVTIVARKQIARHLAALPVVLGPPSIERIYEVARHLATWQPDTVGWSPDL